MWGGDGGGTVMGELTCVEHTVDVFQEGFTNKVSVGEEEHSGSVFDSTLSMDLLQFLPEVCHCVAAYDR